LERRVYRIKGKVYLNTKI